MLVKEISSKEKHIDLLSASIALEYQSIPANLVSCKCRCIWSKGRSK